MAEKKRAPARKADPGRKHDAAPYKSAAERPKPHTAAKPAPGGYGVKPKE